MTQLTFHHLGVACKDLEADTRVLTAMSYRQEGDDFADSIQGIRGRFLVGPGPRLELLVPLGESQVLAPWLKSGVKIYHQAFELEELEAGIADFARSKGKLVVRPVPAVAFGGRRICFVMMPNLMLVELIERRLPLNR